MSKLTKEMSHCPKCGVSWDGGSIFDSFIKQREEGNPYWKDKSDEEIQKKVEECYSPPYRWKRQIGIELHYTHPKHYDGVSYWQCPDCKTTFNRFTGIEEEIPKA